MSGQSLHPLVGPKEFMGRLGCALDSDAKGELLKQYQRMYESVAYGAKQYLQASSSSAQFKSATALKDVCELSGEVVAVVWDAMHSRR